MILRLVPVCLLLAACHSSTEGSSDAAMKVVIGGDRPVMVHVPSSYQHGTPTPLVVMLHGYGADGEVEEVYLDITAQADQRGFIYATPDGTIDSTGMRFWNATDACCDLFGTKVVDSTYLSSVITQIAATYTIDPKRVFLVGHSNGGFMAHRMACDHADQIAAIASLAGAQWNDLGKCTPSEAVSAVEIHGTADMTISYTGGNINGHAFPAATTTASDWVGLDGCATTADTSAPAIDLDSSLAGNETTISAWTGCKNSTHVELWTIAGGGHIPTLSSSFTPDVIAYLFAHAKP